MKQFWLAISWAVLVISIALIVAGAAFKFGVDTGAFNERNEYERRGGGRYVEMQIDGYRYRGWLR